MELSRLSSLLAFVGAINIFYALFSYTQGQWIDTLIPTVTFLLVIFSAARVDIKAEEEMRREIFQDAKGDA
jgi:hypothetical protein